MENGSASAPSVRVVMDNDHVTPFDFVVSLLVAEFNLSKTDAIALAHRAEQNGSATVATITSDAAESLVAAARKRIAESSYPLSFGIENAELSANTSLASVPLVPVRQPERDAGLVTSIAGCLSEAVCTLFFRRGRLWPASMHSGAVICVAGLAMVTQMVAGWWANGEISLPRVWGITSAIAAQGLLGRVDTYLIHRTIAASVTMAM